MKYSRTLKILLTVCLLVGAFSTVYADDFDLNENNIIFNALQSIKVPLLGK